MINKYIVVHSGARDQYKLAETLFKHGKLAFLVTDDIIFRKNYKNLFPARYIKISWMGLLIRSILKVYNQGDQMQRLKNYFLGRTAGKLSKRYKIPLIALQEYAYFAYKYSDVRPRIVFQYHPHSNSNKKILEEEIKLHPESESFKKELSIYTSQKIYEANEELNITDYFIAASSFTKQTLVENGADPNTVFVATYGVNITKYPFKLRDNPRTINFIFVGSFVERKGVYYLLNAVKKLEDEGYDFKLRIVARSDFDRSIIQKYRLRNVEININLSHDELIKLYHTSDVFVFPSLFEGFAFVIVEAMSTGLPVITTPRTIGLDIVKDGEEGFIIEPSNVDALYKKMKYFILNPETCVEMGIRAANIVKKLTWQNFETKVIDSINKIEECCNFYENRISNSLSR